ncbi:MAG TPA: DNA-binding transcriptional regulator, partial [Erwiniaceae bacterium]|nr:DNA-binding transcriptional regulator [Erwiniaceae bacterium]
NCQAWLLTAQTIEGSTEEKARLIASQDVAEVIARFDEVNIAIVGIGILEPSQLLKTSGNYYQAEMLELLAERGAVGDICLHYYDKDGAPVLADHEDPVIGMALDKMKKCPNVVALAGGADKVGAIKGALKGGYVDVLITDYHTARRLVNE